MLIFSSQYDMAIIKTYLEIHKRSDGQWVDPWPSLLHTNFVIGFNWLHSVLFCLSNGVWNKKFWKKNVTYIWIWIFDFQFIWIDCFICLFKKKLFCVVNVPPKIFTGYIFYKLNSIRFWRKFLFQISSFF